MRIGWIGLHSEGIAACDAVLAAGWRLEVIITHDERIARKRSGEASDAYHRIASSHGVRLVQVSDINAPSSLEMLRSLELDVVFVIGWNQILKDDVLGCASIGMIGTHASLLPHNRGSAPINWTIIRGEKSTGNTLIWLASGVDAGDIIDQSAFPISPYDTCNTLYETVADTNRDMILRVLPLLAEGQRPGRVQRHGDEALLMRRRPTDGAVDWSRPAAETYDFIRALTMPYPGAFSSIDHQQVLLWECSLLPINTAIGDPGSVVGPVYSPREAACGQLIACGTGGVVLLSVEFGGRQIRGRALSSQEWLGKVFSNVDE